MPSANEIRQQFIDFFVKKHGHVFVPSSSVVPLDDPTLMFTNAGMNQFKDVFLGTGTRPYKRAVNSQKCIRVSGKHNDLEEVGRDTYHHTFFEMLGNWSFGDYYKAEAIEWAWDLLTNVWGMEKSRLHATVFGGDNDFGLEADEDAAKLWTKVTDIDPKHVHRFGKKDNFWMMGETGPCGPCSEIHVDRTPDKSGGHLVNAGDPRVMEIWNLVFIQYNAWTTEEGQQLLRTWDTEPEKRRDLPERDAIVSKYTRFQPLPAKHVDTGMGFERVCAILQKKDSNYDTDVFSPIMDAIAKLTGKKYGGKLDELTDVAFRVIADHLRMLTLSITDGALPDNKGRGSVMRSILRRAVGFGWRCFGQREPFIYKLVPTLVEHMGGAFPELKKNLGRVAEVIRGEEADFLRTIEKGMGLFEAAFAQAVSKAADDESKSTGYEISIGGRSEGYGMRTYFSARSGDSPTLRFSSEDEPAVIKEVLRKVFREPILIPGEQAFDLYTTYGFPPGMTRQMAQQRGVDVDLAGYENLMREHEDKSRGKSVAAQTVITTTAPLPATNDRPKWSGLTGEGTIKGWIANNEYVTRGALAGASGSGASGSVGLVLDETCFYAEQGGQVGDTGTIATPTGAFEVTQTIKIGNAVAHVGQVSAGKIEVGQKAWLQVNPDRDFTRKNHTATHLLHWALHKVLGEHVEQRGSMVNPQKLTFDFSHASPMTAEEKLEVERVVNEKIYQDLPVSWRELAIDDARKLPGVKAFFGDKYGDVVRIVEIREEPLTPSPSPARGEVSKRGEGSNVFSREFCGGTHLDHTGQAGFFKIVGEETTGKGIRRITAITGKEAVSHVQQLDTVMSSLLSRFRCQPQDLPGRIESLQEENKKLQQQLKKGAATDLAGAADKLLASAAEVGGAKIIIGEMPAGPDEQMRTQIDRLRQKAGSSVIVFGWTTETEEGGKVGLLFAVTDDLVKKGLHAGKLVGQVAKVVGGGGGGKPTLAQAGGKEPAKLGVALELAGKLVREQMGT